MHWTIWTTARAKGPKWSKSHPFSSLLLNFLFPTHLASSLSIFQKWNTCSDHEHPARSLFPIDQVGKKGQDTVMPLMIWSPSDQISELTLFLLTAYFSKPQFRSYSLQAVLQWSPHWVLPILNDDSYKSLPKSENPFHPFPIKLVGKNINKVAKAPPEDHFQGRCPRYPANTFALSHPFFQYVTRLLKTSRAKNNWS